MSLIWDRVTDHDEAGEPNEWLCIRDRGSYVSVHVDYLSSILFPRERRTWQDCGISVDKQDLADFIAGLQSVPTGSKADGA